MERIIKLPLLLEPAVEGGWVVRSPIIPELITEIDHLDEIDEKIKDAAAAAKELYEVQPAPVTFFVSKWIEHSICEKVN